MKQERHLRAITRIPSVAQSAYALKLEATTEIIDRLILVPRQMPWKAGGPRGDEDTTTDPGLPTDDPPIGL